MRGLAERGTSRGAVHAVDARRPAQEEYAQGEYGDEISWFSDSGLVEKVQNRQGLFMYFKRCCGGVRGTSSSMVAAAAWGLARSRGRGPRETRAARRHRECLDKYLPRVKIFEYANDGGHK